MKLTLYAYSGMPVPILLGDRDECRMAAARRLRSLRRDGFPIETLERGRRWEVHEPDDCCLVPDECGILRIQDTAEDVETESEIDENWEIED